MENSNPPNQEVVGDQLIEDISQLKQFSLGEGAAVCQVCGSAFQEGDAVVVYVFRPAGSVAYQVGHVACNADSHSEMEVFTLGVRELLVEGRVGWCSDGATQSSWPVLLAPEVIGVSAAATKSLRRIPDGSSPTANSTPDSQERVPSDSSTKVSVCEAHRRADERDCDASPRLFGGDEA